MHGDFRQPTVFLEEYTMRGCRSWGIPWDFLGISWGFFADGKNSRAG
jgi:hypothetical protein